MSDDWPPCGQCGGARIAGGDSCLAHAKPGERCVCRKSHPPRWEGLFGFGGRVRWLLSRGPARYGMMSAVLLRLAYLGVANMFALLRLLPASDRDKIVEILALRHQITVLERQLGKTCSCRESRP